VPRRISCRAFGVSHGMKNGMYLVHPVFLTLGCSPLFSTLVQNLFLSRKRFYKGWRHERLDGGRLFQRTGWCRSLMAVFFRTILPVSRSMRHFVRVLTTAGLVGYRSVNRVGDFLSDQPIRTSSVIFKIIDVETSGAGMLVRPSISRTFVMAGLSAGISDKEGELLRQLPFTVSCPRLVDPEASSPFSVGAVRRRHRCRHRGIP
jgi:hypothetical protein